MLAGGTGSHGGFVGKFDRAADIFTDMSTRDEFAEFLTLPLYEEI